MVSVIKRINNGRTYYYLEHAVRENNRVEKRSKYLGLIIPEEIEELKKHFLYDLDREKWFHIFEEIKKEYNREERVIPKTGREKNLEEFSVRFTYDTQRIEGSKLTLHETARLLEDGISPARKPLDDIIETRAHQELFYEVVGYQKDLTFQEVLYWHRKLFLATKPDIAGRIRKHGVRITGSLFIPPYALELETLLAEFFSWYDSNKEKLNPIELAALVHLKFVTIHPFSDGNGRLSRLMMNFVLNRNLCPMRNIEYTARNSYYNALERSQKHRDDRPFCQWFFRNYVKEHKRYLMDK